MRAFVIRPFGEKTDSVGAKIDFEQIHAALIAPALKAAGIEGGTTGEIIDSGNIREDMFALIIEADIVVADVTVHNANVFYELGIRHALRKRSSVIIKGKPVKDTTPFDLLTDRYVAYDIADPARACADLTNTLLATIASDRETDSPIFKLLPRLPEADPDIIQVVPTDLTEEVARARSAQSIGWLRLLADDVRGRRFEWPALRLIAQAQFEVKDYEGAGRSWERIRAAVSKDVPANLALANIYHRRYKELNKPEILEASNQAIARVLDASRINPRQRSEVLGLKGRNLKTLWKRDFDFHVNVPDRRHAAVNSILLDSYDAYRNAYLFDLNRYWPGLAALQQGSIALNLATEPAWDDIFDEPQQRRDELARQVAALRPIVAQAVETAIAHAISEDDRLWARISLADLRFLSEERTARVVQAYRDTIPRNNPFAWDAAKAQLQLFADLGFKVELANEVIQKIDPLVTTPKPPRGLHIVVFAGHQIDERNRETPRFPSERENRARALIREQLGRVIQANTNTVVMASAAPGADIICHELCHELSINSTLCLPMPTDDYARLVFAEFDGWRSRYLAIAASTRPVLQLSDQPNLPRWLEGSGLNPWERGNRWVLQMARASNATKVTLVALWDKKTAGDSPGGTADMVKLARDAGDVDIVIIDAAQLLA